MTGFASLRGETPDCAFTLTLKSVNHRHLDLMVRLPGGLDALEATLRRTFKERLHRGHVELSMQFEKIASAGRIELNEDLLAAYLTAFHKASALHGLTAEPDLNELLRLPGVLAAELASSRREDPALEPAVLAAIDPLIAQLQHVREVEGAALAAELTASMRRVEALADEIGQLRLGVTEAQSTRLRDRITELVASAGATVSEDRILMEAAVLAERGDVEEELVRLRTHVTRFIALLIAGGELGRQLDFLLQELNREANTLLSKTGSSSGDAGLRITEIGLQIKVELERAREQVQNLE
jgi:uncharacterized protein (TIGR00255 family)